MAKAGKDIVIHGLYQATRVSTIVLTRRLVIERLLRRVAMPTMASFLVGEYPLHRSAATLLTELSLNATDVRVSEFTSEFALVSTELQDRYRNLAARGSDYPTAWAVEHETSLLLYVLVRLLQPAVILETGVANGHSTFMLLRALAANGHGRCISIDVSADVGGILTADDRKHWQLEVLDRRNSRREFKRLIAEIPTIGLFLHDSEHTYSWQTFEYSNVVERLSEDGVLVSDDIDSSYAFLDFCRSNRLLPMVLLGQRKAVGVVSRKASSRPVHSPNQALESW